jgi:hypothetical protein
VTDPHLDDEQLSLLLDGLEIDARAHMEDEACTRCRDRLAALQGARDAVAAAVVSPLGADVLDRLVGAALAAPEVADVVPITAAPRRRRLSTPPPAWLIGAAAALAALVGVAGLLRAVDVTSGNDAGSMASVADEDAVGGDADAVKRADDQATALAAGAGTAVAGPVDPEVVAADLADQDDPIALAQLLRTSPLSGDATAAFSARSTAGPPSADAAAESSAGGAAPAPAPTSTVPVDRAQCRAQAEGSGAGRYSALLSTATLRWKGEAAEVLVFRLVEPSSDGSITRQALVLARPGCALLAQASF